MVNAELSQLAAECTSWRASLRKAREELSQQSARLDDIALKPVSKALLRDVEHYQNQFRIQLLNVHNLKQEIKEHDRIADWEMQQGTANADLLWRHHEKLSQKFEQLNLTLQSLTEQFRLFSEQVASQ